MKTNSPPAFDDALNKILFGYTLELIALVEAYPDYTGDAVKKYDIEQQRLKDIYKEEIRQAIDQYIIKEDEKEPNTLGFMSDSIDAYENAVVYAQNKLRATQRLALFSKEVKGDEL